MKLYLPCICWLFDRIFDRTHVRQSDKTHIAQNMDITYNIILKTCDIVHLNRTCTFLNIVVQLYICSHAHEYQKSPHDKQGYLKMIYKMVPYIVIRCGQNGRFCTILLYVRVIVF